MNNFVVIDTEGNDILKEIAIIDSDGKIIYEAFTNNYSVEKNKCNHKPLTKIIEELKQILPQQKIICHNAKHDKKILRNSFHKCRQSFPSVEFICTVKLAGKLYPKLANYSLKYLCLNLFLKVDNCLFQDNRAHIARYDAQFTLQLYLHILSQLNKSVQPMKSKQPVSNPFSSNRVDNPFQDHSDFEHIYQSQFHHLQSLVQEIKSDKNKQSKSAVVIGKAGSGKTHLMMRLARVTLKTNRLLYVRQPNNPQSVMHHIYARILESFAQKVKDYDDRTQLDLLLARSFTRILELIQQSQDHPTQKNG